MAVVESVGQLWSTILKALDYWSSVVPVDLGLSLCLSHCVFCSKKQLHIKLKFCAKDDIAQSSFVVEMLWEPFLTGVGKAYSR